MFSRIESIERLADEGGHDARSTFLRVALEQFIYTNQRPTHSEIERFSDLCLALIDKVDSSTRLFLANRLAPFYYAPLPVIERLLLDPHGGVSDEVIRSSCHFTHDDLQKLCLEGKSRHACAVAMRHDLDLMLVRLLVQHKSEKVLQAVLANPDAPLDAEAVRLAVLRIQSGDGEAAMLLQRKDIPALWMASLYSNASPEERRQLRMAVGNESGPPELPIPAETYPYLYTALLRQDMQGLRLILARMLRLAPESTSALFDDTTGELITLAMLAAGCDTQQALSALRCVFSNQAYDKQRFEPMVTALYHDTSRRAARRIVTAVAEEIAPRVYQPHMVASGVVGQKTTEAVSRASQPLAHLLRQFS